MTAIPGMLHDHQKHIVVWRFWETTRLWLIEWMEPGKFKGDEHAFSVRSESICAVVLWWYFPAENWWEWLVWAYLSWVKGHTFYLVDGHWWFWTWSAMDGAWSPRWNVKIKSYCVVFRWGQKGERTWCGCLDSMITGWIRYFFKSLQWWAFAEECLSNDFWTWGPQIGHWLFDRVVSDRS